MDNGHILQKQTLLRIATKNLNTNILYTIVYLKIWLPCFLYYFYRWLLFVAQEVKLLKSQNPRPAPTH